MTEPSPASDAPHRFQRSLSGFGVIILTLSVLSPGVSIFVSGGSIVQLAGSGAIIAFIVGSLVCYCQTTMIAELGAAYPTAGYDYAAIGHAIGDWAAGTSYIATIIGIPLFLNTSAIGIATYLHPFGLPFSDNTVTFAMIALITALSLLNIRSNEYVTGVFMLIEIAALLLVAGVGVWHAQPDALKLVLHPVTTHDGVMIAASVGVIGIAVNNASWSLAGASQAMFFSEDMRAPETIGRIIMQAFAITVVLETAPVIGTIIGAHDLRAVLSADAPFEAFLVEQLPSVFLLFVSTAIAIAIFNACLAGFVGIGRNVFAMGRTKLFADPINRAVMQLIPSTEAPWVAILIIAITTALATYIPLSFKILLLSGNTIFMTIMYVAGVLVGRRSGRTGQVGIHSYRTPLFPLIPLLGIVIVIGSLIVLWLDEAGRKSLLICGGEWVIGFFYYKFVLSRRPGGWRLEGPADIDAQARADERAAAANTTAVAA